MTHHAAPFSDLRFDDAGHLQPAAPEPRLPEYPRIADVLERVRLQSAVATAPAPEPATASTSPSFAALFESAAAAAEAPAAPHSTAPSPVPASSAFAFPAETPLPQRAAARVVHGMVHPDGVVLTPAGAPDGLVETLHVVAAPAQTAQVVEPAAQPEPVAAGFAHDLTVVADDELTAEEVDALIADLRLRDVAREALRARLIAAGQNTQARSAYEIVFLMLAFAATMMIVTPAFERIIHALQGAH